MIIAQLFQNSSQQYYGFQIKGHADYAEEGQDIICSAVSVLALNTINSIEALTAVQPVCEMKDGYLTCRVLELQTAGNEYPAVSLLLDSLALGLKSIVESYGAQYLHVLIIQK